MDLVQISHLLDCFSSVTNTSTFAAGQVTCSSVGIKYTTVQLTARGVDVLLLW
jgi:hypothetical protein